MNKEYAEFLQSDVVQPPEDLSARVFQRITLLLNPLGRVVFAKILGLHAVVGFLSLAICHQFDINPFQTSFSLSDVLMEFMGHRACMVFCGVFFVATTFVLAGFLLSIEELKVLRRNRWVQTASLGMLSLAILFFAGAEVALSMGIYWWVGSWLGGLLSAEAMYKYRSFQPI